MLAPVALFVYNRPDHTRQTVESLGRNFLAAQSDLVIFSDGPKVEAQAKAVDEVRQYVRQIDGFKSVTIIAREDNYGLAKSIISGVTELCERHGKVIVLEDDLITSPHFLAYMNASLDTYHHEEKVMHISGYMFPVENADRLPITFFYRASTCWGWGTWKRAWDCFNSNSVDLLENIRLRKLENEFDIHGTMDFMSMLKSQSVGSIDSWAIRWYATVFLKSGLCLHPAKSLVHNIGHDGSGVHCGFNELYAVDILNVSPLKIEKFHAPVESNLGLEAIKNFNLSIKPAFHLRVFSSLLRKFKKIWNCKMRRIVNE